MTDDNEHPELAGYEPGDGRPLRSRRVVTVMRIVVIVGLVSLVLPGIVTTVSIGRATAERSCALWVAYEVPDATGSSVRFEIFGPGVLGWECYSVGAFGGDGHVASLGLIPGPPRLPLRTGVPS